MQEVISNDGSSGVFDDDVGDRALRKDTTAKDITSLCKTADALQHQQHVIDRMIGHPRLGSAMLTPGIRGLFSNSPALGQPGDNLILQLHSVQPNILISDLEAKREEHANGIVGESGSLNIKVFGERLDLCENSVGWEEGRCVGE